MILVWLCAILGAVGVAGLAVAAAGWLGASDVLSILLPVMVVLAVAIGIVAVRRDLS